MPFDDTMFLKANVDVLSFFSDDQIRRITAIIERKSYNKGNTVMFQGEVSNNFSIIRKGKVVVVAKSGKDKVELAELKPGDFFGEMSILESTSATATIKAVEDETEILMIPHEAFQKLLEDHPVLKKALLDKIATRKQAKADALPKKEG